MKKCCLIEQCVIDLSLMRMHEFPSKLHREFELIVQRYNHPWQQRQSTITGIVFAGMPEKYLISSNTKVINCHLAI